MDKATTEHLNSIIASAVVALGFELVGCELLPIGGRSLLRVYIDREGGVSIDDCTQASRQIGAVLDVEDPIRGRYQLEVSSPGSDRILVTLAHYQRFIGHKIRIKLQQPLNGRRNFTGELLAVTENEVSLQVDADVFHLKLADVEKANLVPQY